MSDVLTIINAMRAADCDDATILRAVEAAERQKAEKAQSAEAEKAEARREADKIRKRRRRAAQRTENTQSASFVSSRTFADTEDTQDIEDPSPHTPQPESISPLKKTPKGVQKGPKIDRTELNAGFDRIWAALPPNAKRKGQEACRMALARAVAKGAKVREIEIAVGRWVDENDKFVERFDTWVAGDQWKVWLPTVEPIKAPDTPEAWARRIEFFQRRGDWHAPGPQPDQPGCLAPPDVLERAGYPQIAVAAGGRR